MIMKKLFLIVLGLLGLGVISLNAQTYCMPDGQNTSGVIIDSVSFVGSPLIILGSTNYAQEATDTIDISGGVLEFSLYSREDTIPPITDSVYWRISIDADADGVFDDTDVIFQTDTLVATGEFQSFTNLPNYNFAFGTTRQVLIELATDTTLFGTCNPLPAGTVYSSVSLFAVSNNGKLVVKNGNNKSKNSDARPEIFKNSLIGSDCEDCLPLNDTLIYRLYTAGGGVAYNVKLQQLSIFDGRYDEYIPSTTTVYEVEFIDDSNGGQITVDSTPPFDIDIENGDTALVKITYQLGAGEKLYPSGMQGNIIADFDYNNSNTSTTSPPNQLETGNIQLYMGCHLDTCVVYDLHATSPMGSEAQLPFYTGAFKSITAEDDVTVEAGDEAIFRVDQDGFILIKGGVQVESGSYFWAYKDTFCLTPTVPGGASGSLQSETEDRSVEQSLFHQIEVYPNPFTDILAIKVPYSRDVEYISIKILDAFGRILSQYTGATSEFMSIDTQSWRSGMYIVQIEINGSVDARKLVKVD